MFPLSQTANIILCILNYFYLHRFNVRVVVSIKVRVRMKTDRHDVKKYVCYDGLSRRLVCTRLYIGIGKYLSVCQNFSARGRPEGGAGPPNVNWGSPLS